MDVELMLTISESNFVSRNKLTVIISDKYNRKNLPKHYENNINEVWDRKLAQNDKIWNGTKFRIDSAMSENGFATLHLGLTDYKDFIGTNWSPNSKLYLEFGRREQGNAHAFMSDALGVGALVITGDNYVIFLKRSECCAEAPGMWDIPGGHPEPKVTITR